VRCEGPLLPEADMASLTSGCIVHCKIASAESKALVFLLRPPSCGSGTCAYPPRELLQAGCVGYFFNAFSTDIRADAGDAGSLGMASRTAADGAAVLAIDANVDLPAWANADASPRFNATAT
jgi:hypothetical protein